MTVSITGDGLAPAVVSGDGNTVEVPSGDGS